MEKCTVMCVFFVKFRPLPGSFVKKNHWIFNFLENFWFKAVSEWPPANNLVVIIFVNCYATLRILLKSHVAWKRIGSGWLYDYRKISYNYMKVQITEDKYFTLSFYTTCFMKSITTIFGALVRKTIFLIERSAVFDWTLETLVVTCEICD